MKNCLLLLTLMASLYSNTQPVAGYTGKAKTFVDNFWKLAADIKKQARKEVMVKRLLLKYYWTGQKSS